MQCNLKTDFLDVTFDFFKKLGFTSCKAEQPLRGKRLQDTENLFRENLQLKDVC